MDRLAETLFLKKKDKKHEEKNLTINLLELILVGKIMTQIMKLVEYRCLSVSLKTKKKEKKIKELEDEIKKLKLQLTNLSVQNNDDNDDNDDNDNKQE